ncbi:nucleoside triphosphate pyrophosphohydrolase [Hwanghaeella sp. LZ110]|uniref:nucleoside triphosphate pyrophosphohydrolase n=1 Tax=Hwanghaeella sp. LZ110 TaxID=3402810 RepID=UPI003B67D476
MTDTSNIDRLLAVMARLRDPNGGCPWDLQQDFTSIAPYTIEEAYEVADAIERGDRNDLKDELGDLLLQVVFHARMAQEEGSFDFDAVAGAITDKMIRRHPHVFGSHVFGKDGADTPDKVKASWEETKAAERAQKGQDDSALSGVARALPALIRAEKLSKRAARVGFTWSEPSEVFRDLEEEVEELKEVIAEGGDPDRLEDEMGDILFVAANLARMLKVDPEKALARTNRKFEMRFRAVEAAVAADGKRVEDVPLAELDQHWNAAKGVEK